MAFDNNSLSNSIAAAVNDSFNSTEENNLEVGVDVTDSFNEDNSVNDSDNTTVGIDNSGNTETNDTDIDIIDSGNSFEFDAWIDASDNSINDDSINAGVRSYNLGFDGFAGAGVAGAVHGDVLINNQNTVVDQSSSNNILAAGDVFQGSANQAQVASGEGAYAAGDNIDITTTVNQSTNIAADGDVLIDSEKNVEFNFNSGNEYNFDYSYEDNSIDVDVDDSFNDYSLEVGINDSFNDESLFVDYTDIDVNIDAIVDSTVVDTGDIDVIL
jgi:hypothetical protein